MLKKLGCIKRDCPFSSIQVNHNPTVSPHRDKNGGLSRAVSFGDFEGGVLTVCGKSIDIFQNPITFDGSDEHWVTPHSGDRWSLVIFMHAMAANLSVSQKQILKKVGFNLGTECSDIEMGDEGAVSIIERGNFACVPPSQKRGIESLRDRVSGRSSFCVIEWATGILPASFAMDLLRLKYRAWICTSDSEVTMCLPHAKLSADLAGDVWSDQRVLAASIAESMGSEVPVFVANISRLALERQCNENCAAGMDLFSAAKSIALFLEILDCHGGGQTKAIIISDVLDQKGIRACEDAFGTLPFAIDNCDFAPYHGTVWAWIRGQISWPKGSHQPRAEGIPKIKPPKDYRWKASATDVIQRPWSKLNDKLFLPLQPKTIDGIELTGSNRGSNDDRRKIDSYSQEDHLYHDDNMVSSAKSGVRRLWAAEEERLLGLPDGASNVIEKIPGESRERRQLRRQSLISATLSVRIMLFLMEAVAVNAEAIVSRDPLPFGIDKIISEDVLGASPFNRQRSLNGIEDRYVPPDECEMDAQLYGYLAEGLQSRRMPSSSDPDYGGTCWFIPFRTFRSGAGGCITTGTGSSVQCNH